MVKVLAQGGKLKLVVGGMVVGCWLLLADGAAVWLTAVIVVLAAALAGQAAVVFSVLQPP
jgi:hypothetical protein